MSHPHFFNTITQTATAEFKDRGSRFIAYAYPVTDITGFKSRLAALKKEHPKAVHHCFAYRLGTDGNNYRVSDDGEPSGTAGRPILGQIDSRGLTNILVIVVRYFGGTLLGVPGLINAYKSVTAFALDSIPVVQQPVLINYRLQFDYTQMNNVMQLVKQLDCRIYKQDMQLFCVLEIGIPMNTLELVLGKLQDFHGIEIDRLPA